ncbi:MAG TPA: tetratricopeptide repeat protein [Dongiaceae bacterium]|nr:tetratricopeptide repeat protein [Dongiaceae bacterium]
MSETLCPMLSALPPVDTAGQPVNRECLKDPCRFYDRKARDCGLSIAARLTTRLADEAQSRADADMRAAVLQSGQTADRVAALESTVNGLGSALARLESQMASIIEVQQKVADRLLEEMSLLNARTQKNDQAIAAVGQRIEAAEASQKTIVQSLEVRLKKDEEDLAAGRRDEAVTCNNRGVALYYRGALEAARDAFKRSVDLHPGYAEALNNLGLAESRLGREAEAIEAFRQALVSDPKMGEAYNNLGFLYHTSSQFDRAAQMFGLAIENAGDSSIAYTNLGNTYYAMQQAEKAVEAWKRAVDLDPMNENARRGLRMFQEDANAA